MKLLCAKQFVVLACICSILTVGILSAGESAGAPEAAASVAATSYRIDSQPPVRAFPRIRLWGSQELTYVGMFGPDAVFRTTSKLTGATGSSPGEGILPAPSPEQGPRSSYVPESMLLSNERVVENLEPPAHLQAIGHAPAPAEKVRNRFMTYTYGRPSVVHAPTHLATDSRQRVIVSDPGGDAVHVLDPKGRTSFRILSGKGRRLQEPAGVAVDADDNIYVADSTRGMVLVFDRYGSFLRYIGDFDGEPQYQGPHGIAIDRKAGHLYLVDSPRNLVFMLDLKGTVLKRMGKYRDGTGVGEFDYPTDIAVNHNLVFVLDSSGSRVQSLDSDCNLLGSFNVPRTPSPQANRENGLGADSQGNVYVSFFNRARILAYSQDGHLLASFGQPGPRVGEFAGPDGLWIDAANRVYVADSGNGRVQLFQLSTE
jgi:DNA-binding beta-propeller fold protein YncE